ncbi:hypothetical protein Agub_g3263 [Astrephomene gubernaculifera]|uniref:Structural maintenance of chromosomes protein 5 n=1 Tax=Astrephomene gubernaculifera TaxID=47775 RepID=A0AAD3DM62_9CHLO|nr:hypothetical protein Agub_g3263 [Astrephomene gubernaculifera]
MSLRMRPTRATISTTMRMQGKLVKNNKLNLHRALGHPVLGVYLAEGRGRKCYSTLLFIHFLNSIFAHRTTPFAKGAVKEVKVYNFMTYGGPVTIKPGPRLNLVLGPNGTGKSSFVCALCLGLNGSPKTLGRADNLRDFVRRGCHSFWTEITLSSGGEGRDHVVRRTVKTWHDHGTDRYESKWTINGRDATSKDVDKLVKQLNVQFDNLCQFLPQDKVVEFAHMDKYQLLAATEKALGDSSLHDQHQRLKQLRQEEKQAAADRGSTATRLTKLQADQERQERDYQRFQERERLLGEARSLRCQAKWLAVCAKARAAEAAKKKLEEERAELRRLEALQEEDTQPIRQREEDIKAVKLQRTQLEQQGRRVDRSMQNIRDKLDKIDNDVNNKVEELASLEDQARSRQAAIAAARQRLAEAQEQLASAPERPSQDQAERAQQFQQQFQASRREVGNIEGQRNQLASQIQAVQADIGRVRERLDTLNSRKYQLLQRLQASHRNIASLHAWVEEHREDGTFRGPVFGPLALELSVAGGAGSPLAVQYVENTCFTWLGSYLVTCREDETTLAEKARSMDVHNVKVLATTYDPATPFQPQYPAGTASQHARYGIMHTLDELVEAPHIIMHALNKQCRLDSVFVGNDHAVSCMDTLGRETPVSTVLVGTVRYSVIKSRYADVRNIEQRELFPVRVLGAGGGAEEDQERAALLERERELTQERDALQSESDQLEQQRQQHEQQQEQCRREIERYNAECQRINNKRGQLMGAVQTAQRALQHKEALPDPELRRPLLRHDIHSLISQHAVLVGQLLAASQEAWQVMRAGQLLELRQSEMTAQLEALQAARRRREGDLQAARNTVEDADRRFRAELEESKRAKERAQEEYPPTDADKEEIKRLEREKVPSGSLLQQAEAKEAEAEQVVCANQNVVAEYRKRAADIAQLQADLERHDAELVQLRARIEELRNLWLPEIQAMVSTINSSFSANFKEIGCAGEVRLHEDEDYDKFAIEILVQFRAHEEMQLLTAHRQSGGERSVSTILYLIALQAVTDTPFRVVDEINQGMDPINERKVFQQLVIASTAANTPQCFMLTPKLLPNLVYSRDIVVLTIMSSPHIAPALVTGHTSMRQALFGKRYCLEHPRDR